MKVHKITLSVIDLEDVGAEEIKNILENQKYPNYCIAPRVEEQEEREIGEFTDDHPLNKGDTAREAFKELFNDAIDERILDLMARAEKYYDKPHQLYNGIRLLVEEAINQKIVTREDAADALEQMEQAYNKPRGPSRILSKSEEE
jgi:hypothetical protein